MSTIPTYFNDFLANIRLPDYLKEELIKAHKDLREKLRTDDITKELIVDSFLQGSYARSTCIKPATGHKADVDVIAVTNINHQETLARKAFAKVMPFAEKYYDDVEQQGRSIGISLDLVDMDLVITAVPSEEVQRELVSARLFEPFTIKDLDNNPYGRGSIHQFFNTDSRDKAWQDEPLWIPDNENNKWYRTHPLEQIRWTHEKNKKTDGHYVNVVKALKWWKRVNLPQIKHPKSYPLEHFIGDCCPNGITSVAEGITRTLECIAQKYPTKPVLHDRGVPEHDVFESLSTEEYRIFYNAVRSAAKLARQAYDCADTEESVRLWRAFFKDSKEFPPYSGGSNKGFTPRVQPSETIPTGRFG